MAQAEIRVHGLSAAIAGLRRDGARIREGIVHASRESADLLKDAAIQQSPTNKPEVIGNIFTRVSTSATAREGESFAGFHGFGSTSTFRGAGGLFRSVSASEGETVTVELGIRGKLGVAIEGGTGIFAEPTPHTPWTIYAKPGSGLAFHGARDGKTVVRKLVYIKGARPDHFLEKAVEISRTEVEALFEAHISFVDIV